MATRKQEDMAAQAVYKFEQWLAHSDKRRRDLVVRLALILAIAAVLVVSFGWVKLPNKEPEYAGQAPLKFNLSAAQVASAQAQLEQLRVAPKASGEIRKQYSGHREDLFGAAWSDSAPSQSVAFAHNGCKTRDDILKRDLIDVQLKDGDKCVVQSGSLYDPYTGRWIEFQRGKKSALVQIDHVVALGDVWASGGDKLTEQQRYDVANDPINLVAVDGATNGAKSDKDAADWLPPNKAIHCFYAASQVGVKAKYGLTVTEKEHDALAKELKKCPAGV